jgi:probable F420-dependent oxidoreductase
LQIGVNLTGSDGLVGGVKGMLDAVVLADRKGVDLIQVNKAAHERRRETNAFPFVLEQDWYEPIAFLSAAAALTRRVRLSTFVLIATLRPTLLLAKQLATLDVISDGRVTIALGVGWQEEEFRASGMAFEGRFGDLEDQVAAMRALWSPPPAQAQGRNFAFEDFYSLPAPVQGRDLPILFGFNPTDRNLDRIARLGQGWAVDPAHRAVLAEKVQALRALFTHHGRDASAIEVHAGMGVTRAADGTVDAEAVLAGMRALQAAGATTISFLLRDACRQPAQIEPFLDLVLRLKDELA